MFPALFTRKSNSFAASVFLYHTPSVLVRQAHYVELSGGDTHRVTITLRRGDEHRCWAKTLEVIPGLSYSNDGTVSDNKDLLEWERHTFISFFAECKIQQMGNIRKTSLSVKKILFFAKHLFLILLEFLC